MKAFLDTSVLVATFYVEHEHHEPSFKLFLQQNKQTGCTAAHCLMEVYAVLTGMPGKERVSPDEALLFLADVRERLTVVALTAEETVKMLQDGAAAAISGGGVYDAGIGRCATQAKAETIYTWNTRHFTRLGEDVAKRVKTPSENRHR